MTAPPTPPDPYAVRPPTSDDAVTDPATSESARPSVAGPPAPPAMEAPHHHVPYPQTAPSRPQPHGPGIAVWALVLAMIPTVASQIAAVVMGLVAVSRGALQERRGMAVAALCVSALWIVVGTVAAGLAIGAAQDDRAAGVDYGVGTDDNPYDGLEGAFADTGEHDVFELALGDCTGEIPSGDVLTFRLIPCDEPHVGEVFHQSELDGGRFPGQDEVDRLSDEACYWAFESFVGLPYDESSLDYFLRTSAKGSWSTERGVSCVLVDDGEVTGSLRGAGR